MEMKVPPFSDEYLALRFAETHQGNLRYVSATSRWYWWDGRCWRQDKTLLGFRYARQVCRQAAAECNIPAQAKGIASAKTTAATEKLAKADHRLAATVDQWDNDPWLLNTPNGVIDLRTGNMRGHSAKDHMTKICNVSPDKMGAPIWNRFLKRITNDDIDLQAYLQRIAGYSLTGITHEHAMWFLWGVGANGKSVFIETLLGILGDYA